MFILSALRGGMGLVRAALASILLVWVPMADAATCGVDHPLASPDFEASALQSGGETPMADMSSPTPDGSSSLPADAQHCVHGHCHQPVAPQSTYEAPVIMPKAAAALRRELDVVFSYVTAGLERPPKA